MALVQVAPQAPPWNFNYRRVLLEEVALEGLDGISIKGLWKRLEHRMSLQLPEKMKAQMWSTLLSYRDSIAFFELPVPAPEIIIQDRFSITNEKGNLMEPEEPLEGPYTYSPVSEQGSCEHYDQRKKISHDEISALSLQAAIERWGDCLVVVASAEERWRALSPHLSKNCVDNITPQQYCLLELVGKSRENGVMTAGRTNVIKIVKDPKLIFYLRKNLQKQKLITAKQFIQSSNGKMSSCLLLRLLRFTAPKVVTLPRNGLIHKLITRLRTMPDQMECFAGIQKFLGMNFKEMKYFTRRQETMHFFKIVHKPPPSNKRKRGQQSLCQFMQLDIRSDESSASEAEEAEGADRPECRSVYRVGVGLLRQAYQMIGESGQTGVTVVQLSKMLNVDFYCSRGLIYQLVRTKLIKHILEDKGKQRVGRYISLASVAEKSSEYAIEKEKLFKFLKDLPNKQPDDSSRDASQSCSMPVDLNWNPSDNVTEVRKFENIGTLAPFSQAFTSNEGKLPSFRQLIIGNAIVKAIWEREVVYGTHELNQLIRKETGLELMDGKTIKRTLQRLILDNLMHYYRIRWPVKHNHFTILLCAPHITIDHPIIKTNFRDICLKAYRSTNQEPKVEKPLAKDIPDVLTRISYCYPRYLRARKLHEFLFNVVYVEDVLKGGGGGLPPGCFNLVNVIPEMTVNLVLGHTANKNLELMELASDNKSLQLKIKDAPKNICSILLGSLAPVLTIKRNIRTLASFGLIQFCDEYCQQSDGAKMINKAVYYLNRNAKILDTAGKWPEEGRKCEWKKFHFGTAADVINYWTTFYNTSINTIITTPKSEDVRAVAPPVPVCKPEEAAERDTGDFVAGDGLGAAGMDSTYHVELPRLWSAAFLTASNPAGLKRKLVDLQKFQPRVLIPRKRRCLARADPPKSKAAKKKAPKPSKAPTVPAVKPKPPSHQKKRNRIMTLSRWSPLEDKVILWTRVAKTVMSPTSSPGALQIANFVARDIVTRLVEPKNASTCHSRAMSLERLPSVLKVKDKLMMELRRRPEIFNKYNGMCRKIRLKHIKQFSKYLQEGQVRMAELVWLISKLPVINTYDQSFPCVASDLREVEEHFNVKCTKRDVFKSTERTLEEVQVATIEQGIIQMMNTLVHVTPTMEHSMKIYNVFKDCSEVALRKAVDHLRRTGVVVHKDKSSNVRKLTPKEAVAYSSTFKISAAYMRCWQNIYSTGFPGKVTHALEVMVPSNDVESSPQMACILLELSVAGDVEMTLTKKPTVKALGGMSEPDIALVDVDERVSVKLQRGKVGWKLVNSSLSRISDLFDDIALTNEVSCLSSKSLFVPPATHESPGIASEIINFLEEKRELGATFEELVQTSGMTREILQDNLKKLEIKNIIKKVGFTDSHIVLWKYIDPWVIMLENDCIVPAPWLSMEKTLKQSVFIGWCGAVAQKIIDYPGSSISKIAELCVFLAPKHVEDICNFLLSFDCIKMMRIVAKEPDLFSDDDQEIVMDDLYEYASPEYVLVFPVCDSLVRYSLVKKKLSEYKP